MKIHFCPVCKEYLAIKYNFCAYCGVSLEDKELIEKELEDCGVEEDNEND